ncbi:MAG: hypothetical protein LBP22_13750 [Deltaproteobacteria bacterium]|nr:hypothetical protein [Deltaproteobacteria bacterium]
MWQSTNKERRADFRLLRPAAFAEVAEDHSASSKAEWLNRSSANRPDWSLSSFKRLMRPQ